MSDNPPKPQRHLVAIDGLPALEPTNRKEEIYRELANYPKPKALLQCPRCGCREAIETVTGAVYVGEDVMGGAKSWMCFHCMMEGTRTLMAV
jgi:hypothetical protein